MASTNWFQHDKYIIMGNSSRHFKRLQKKIWFESGQHSAPPFGLKTTKFKLSGECSIVRENVLLSIAAPSIGTRTYSISTIYNRVFEIRSTNCMQRQLQISCDCSIVRERIIYFVLTKPSFIAWSSGMAITFVNASATISCELVF